MSERGPRHIVTQDDEPIPNPDTNQDQLPFGPQPEAEQSTIVIQPPEEYAAPPEATEQLLTPEQQQDAANRFTDAELLGRSYPVRRLVKTIGNERVHAWESAKAGVANAWDTPGKLIRQGLHDRASRKVDEINANHKAEREAALQAGVSSRLLQHRLSRIDKKYNRKKARWGGRLDRRKQSLDARVNRMNARTESVKSNHEKRHAETIAFYKAKKEKALARKSLRRELRSQGASWHETFAVMKDIPQSERKRIGEAAIRVHASERSAKSSERSAKQSDRYASSAENSLLANVAKSERLANQAKEADQTIDAITSVHLPEARASLDALQEQLGQLPEDSPERSNLQVKIQETEDKIKVYEERELPYWHSVAKKYREQVNTLLSERASLQQIYQGHQETAARHSETAANQRRATQDYVNQRKTETNTVLNSEKEPSTHGNS